MPAYASGWFQIVPITGGMNASAAGTPGSVRLVTFASLRFANILPLRSLAGRHPARQPCRRRNPGLSRRLLLCRRAATALGTNSRFTSLSGWQRWQSRVSAPYARRVTQPCRLWRALGRPPECVPACRGGSRSSGATSFSLAGHLAAARLASAIVLSLVSPIDSC